MLVREERFILSGLLVLLAPLNVSAIKESITGYVVATCVLNPSNDLFVNITSSL